MSCSSTITTIPPAILDQAIAWIVKLGARSADASMQARLQADCDAWRRADPLHEAAWCELQAAQQDFGKLSDMSHSLAFDTLENAQRDRRTRQGRRKALRLLGLGATALIAGTLAADRLPWHEWKDGLGADYATGTGERRTIRLADDTEIRLNTATAIDVRFIEGQRLVVLHHGEIFIHTGADDKHAGGHRPFRVQTGQSRLEALGTQFLVRQEDAQTRLLVTEGRVAIGSNAERQVAMAGVGDEFLIDATGAAVRVSSMQTFDPAGWLDGALVVKQMRLEDFTKELSRYRAGWLRCDPAVADLRVSGVFQTDDTDRALAAVARVMPVRIERRTRYWITLVPA